MNADGIVRLYLVEGSAGLRSAALPGTVAEPDMTRSLPTSLAAAAPPPGKAETRAKFDAAMVMHRPELLGYLHRRLGDRELAADLTQETLSRAMRYRDDASLEDPRLMLFRIAHNLVLEHRRTDYRHHAAQHVPLDDAVPLLAEAPPVEATLDARNAIDMLLRHTIAELPPKCRLAFMLSRFDGMSYPQIAERMGISVKMVEKHITRALLACRAAVGDRDF